MQRQLLAASIIIPCHNHRQYLWEALESIYSQKTSFDFEVIVVDDASDDNPKPVGERFGTTYAKVEAHNANIARNHGLKLARGAVIVWFDADNIMLPGGLEALVKPILENRADATYGRFELFGDVGRYPYTSYNQLQYGLEDLKLGGCIDTASAVKRDQLTLKPWDENITRTQDWDYHLSNLKQGLDYIFVEQAIFKYRLVTNQEARDYHTVASINQNLDYIRQKHHLNTSSQAEITIGLPSIGRYYCVEQWLRAVRQLDYPKHKINLAILDQSNNQSFFNNYLLPFAQSVKLEYNAVHIRSLHRPKKLGSQNSLSIDNQAGRLINIAEMMQYFSSALTTPYLFILEDDTTCPPDTLNKLLQGIKSNPECVAIQGIERSRFTKYSLGAWVFNQDNIHLNLYPVMRHHGLREVGAGGFYCLLLTADWCHNYNFHTDNDPATATNKIGRDPDIVHGLDIQRAGKKILMDWSVQCTHYSLTPDGQIFPLELKAFGEPDDIFLNLSLPANRYVYTLEPAESRPLGLTARPANLSLIIHSVETPDQVTTLINQVGPSRQLILIPTNQQAYRVLSAQAWPSNTILKSYLNNLADNLTACLAEADYSVLILSASAIIAHNTSYLINIALAQSAVTTSSKSYYRPPTASWQPAKPVKFITHPAEPGQQPIISLSCVAITKNSKDLFKLEPRLGNQLPLLEWQLSRQLWQHNFTITTAPYTALESTLNQVNDSFYFHLGVWFGLEIPLKQLPNFVRYTLKRTWPTTPKNLINFYRGLLTDILLRFNHHQPRRKYLSPTQYAAIVVASN